MSGCVNVCSYHCASEADSWSVRSVTAYPNAVKSSQQTASISDILASLPLTDTCSQFPRMLQSDQRASGLCMCMSASAIVNTDCVIKHQLQHARLALHPLHECAQMHDPDVD